MHLIVKIANNEQIPEIKLFYIGFYLYLCQKFGEVRPRLSN